MGRSRSAKGRGPDCGLSVVEVSKRSAIPENGPEIANVASQNKEYDVVTFHHGRDSLFKGGISGCFGPDYSGVNTPTRERLQMPSVYIIDEANLQYSTDTDPPSSWTDGVPTESGTTASVEPTFIRVTSGQHGSLVDITDTENDGVFDENRNSLEVQAQTINGGAEHIWVDYYLEVTDPEDGSTFRVYAVSTSPTPSNGPNDTGQIGYVSEEPLRPGVDYIVTGSGSTHSTSQGGEEPFYSDLTEFCFCTGTRIMTRDGWQAVETLEIGSEVWTRDHGYKPVGWIGITQAQGPSTDIIRFAPDSVGNKDPLCVSPNHRMVVSNWRSQLMLGQDEVLIPAKNLVDGTTVTVENRTNVQFVHLMFDQHEIINAEGALTESFFVGDYSASALDAAAREEILALFPQLRDLRELEYSTALPLAKKYEASLVSVH